jgi:hypothetical protein
LDARAEETKSPPFRSNQTTARHLEWVSGMGERMTKTSLHVLKGVGYLISTASVILLAIVSWSSASNSPVLTVCLLAGGASSIVGMFCRWLTYEIEKRRGDEQ